jgi:uncharacterized metal-binding protein YceD (DUF177 family)
MGRNRYEIAFVGLQPGLHHFEYQIDDRFFLDYQEQDFKNCHANIKLSLEKNTSFMMLNFEIGGSVSTICDRCGNELNLKLWDDFKLIVKLEEDPDKMNEEEEDPDVFYLARTESMLDIKDWIYEFVNLSIPMQKVCADDASGNSTCNQEVIARLKDSNRSETDAKKSIWKDLDQFKDFDN